jgi:hypothetical protein
MASLELSPLSEHLDEDEVASLSTALTESGARRLELDDSGDPVLLDGNLDDDIFASFLDRLDANYASCDIYVPADFEDVVEVAGNRVGSAHALMLVLEGMKDEFFAEEDEEEEEEEEYEAYEDEDEEEAADEEELAAEDDEEDQLKNEQMRHIWRVMYRGAKTCVSRGLCLFVHT